MSDALVLPPVLWKLQPLRTSRAFGRLLTLLAALLPLVSAPVLRTHASPAGDDPGMADGYRILQESNERYEAEIRLRAEGGRPNLMDAIAALGQQVRAEDLAGNDVVTGLAGSAMEQLAAPIAGEAVGKTLGVLPIDDIAKTAGHYAGGDGNAAANSYARGFVGTLAGTVASYGAGALLVGSTAPAWVTGGAVLAAGIGVGYATKQGWDWLMANCGPAYGRDRGSSGSARPGETVSRNAGAAFPAVPLRPVIRIPPELQIPGVGSAPVAAGQPAAPPAPPNAPQTTAAAPRGVARPTPARGSSPSSFGLTAVVCKICKHEAPLSGPRPPETCPNCGRSKGRLLQSNGAGKVVTGVTDWFSYKGRPSPLPPGTWVE